MNTNRTIEITAKTEEEARGIANGELNDNEMVITSEVISAPARGIFGFVGKQEFKIRFTIGEKPAPKVVEKLVESRRDHQDEPMPPRIQKPRDYDEPMPARSPRPRNSEAPRPRDNDSSRPPRRNAPRPSSRTGERDSRPRNPRFNDGESDFQADLDVNLPERPKADVSEDIKKHPFYSEIFALIKDVAANVGIADLEMTDYVRDGAWVIEASGENVSQLIGKRGRTLDSLQYLMNIIFNKGNDDRVKLVLDVQGYREKRYRNLIMLANRMCRKAVSARRQVELEPMSTLDRRTIHMALKDRTDIETFSKGMEPMRRVVISPLKKKKTNSNADWQPMAEEADSDFSEKLESSGSVPMFMEEDV